MSDVLAQEFSFTVAQSAAGYQRIGVIETLVTDRAPDAIAQHLQPTLRSNRIQTVLVGTVTLQADVHFGL